MAVGPKQEVIGTVESRRLGLDRYVVVHFLYW